MYPLQATTIKLPVTNQPMLLPLESAVQQQYEAQLANGENPAFPFWARLWPSAIALAGFLQLNPAFAQQKRVLELAAGLGLPSMVAAAMAKQVWCTELAAEAIPVIEKNIAENSLQNMRCSSLHWNEAPNFAHQTDLLLLSDVNYEPEVFESLLRVLQHFYQQHIPILLATPQRLMAKPFIEQLLPMASTIQSEQIKWQGNQHFISILVLEKP